MHRVKLLDSGQLQIDTKGVKVDLYQVDLVAISAGGVEGFAHIHLDFIPKFVAANIPPSFDSTLNSLIINKVDNSTQVY